jgi:lipopolysaccharide/colanic/teichoic acid biosynthesis glycosyltransferase
MCEAREVLMTRLTLLNEHQAAIQREGAIPAAANCQLQWRQKMLWVGVAQLATSTPVPALLNQSWLLDCLMRSPIQRIVVDPALGEAALNFWADLGQKTGKPVYLRVYKGKCWLQTWDGLAWQVKGVVDRVVTALLLAVLSPLWFVLVGLLAWQTTDPLFTEQWRVGARGRLFRMRQFRLDLAMLEADVAKKSGDRFAAIKLRVAKLGLARLPQLLHVLRGEMSLVGSRSLSLAEAARLEKSHQQRLKALPGLLTPRRPVKFRNGAIAANSHDLGYLQTWSLVKDVEILLLAIPQFFWWSIFAISTVFSLTAYAS